MGAKERARAPSRGTFVECSQRTAFLLVGCGAALVVACTPAPPPTSDGDSSASADTNDQDTSSKAKTTGATAAAESATPSSKTSGAAGNGSGGERAAAAGTSTSLPPSDPYQQCMVACIGPDPVARDIMTTFESCSAPCDDGDDECFQNCVDAVQPTCDANQDSCNTYDSCDDQCWGTSATPADTGAGGYVPTYDDVAPIIDANCAGCHDDFSTWDDVAANRAAMISKVSSGAMPKDQTNWFQTQDGQTLLDYLERSPDFQ